MRKRTKTIWILGLMASGCSCGEEEQAASTCAVSCANCCTDGEACSQTRNCGPGRICNHPREPLYDPESASDICVPVLCPTARTCEADEVCSAAGICEPKTCALSSECRAGERCSAGACVAAPMLAAVERCVLVPHRLALIPGATTDLEVVAFGNDGLPRTVPTIEASISAEEGVVSANARTITAGSNEGVAVIRARVGELSCEGAIEVINHGALAPGAARVVLVSRRDGRPLEGAALTIEVAGVTSTASTDARGAWIGVAAGPIARVTATAPGHSSLTVLDPGGLDLVLALPDWEPRRRFAVQSEVGAGEIRQSDVGMIWSGGALVADLADLGYRDVLEPMVPFHYSIPELSYELDDTYPAGIALQFGPRSGGGCGVETRTEGLHQGCAFAVAADPVSTLWAIAASIPLVDIGKRSFGTLLPQRNIGVAFQPLVTFDRGLLACDAEARICEVEAGSFASTHSEIARSPQRRAIVDLTLPDLPDPCDAGVTLMIATALPGRGLIPLGFVTGQREPDRCIWEAANAFERGFPAVEMIDGRLLASYSPPPIGAEDHPLYAVAIVAPGAVSQDLDHALVGAPTDAFTTMVAPVDAEGVHFSGGFMPWPTATLKGAGAYRIDADPTATLVRLDRRDGDHREILYAPASRNELALTQFSPSVSPAEISVVRTTASYADLFRLGSGRTLEAPEQVAAAAAVVRCGPTPGPCAPR